MGIRYLTENAKRHADGNHPNADREAPIVILDARGRKRVRSNG
jgi:hypothetical protein